MICTLSRMSRTALMLAALIATHLAFAQGRFPDKPVSLVVPFPPGGVADIVARAMAPAMEASLGQPVIVLNKPGAGGALGTAFVTSSKPDGHTLLMALSSVSTNPEQEQINNRPAPFQLDQLLPLARISKEDMMLAVRADSPYTSLAEIVADARGRPGAISYASSGVYGVYHVATEMLAETAGVTLLHAPYAGGSPALTALLGGQVDIGLVTRSVGAPQIKAGKLKPLAAWGDARWKDYPDVPSMKELGYQVDYTLWSGLFAPAGLSPEVTQVLRAAIRSAVADPRFAETMSRLGAPIVYLDAPEFRTYWAADAARMIRSVRKIGKLQ